MVLARGTARAAAAVCATGVLTLAGCSSGDDRNDGGTADAKDTAAATVSTSAAPPASASPSPPASPSLSASVPVSATPTPVPVTGPGQKLVTMTVTGGFAGVDHEVVLRGDGTVRATDRGEATVHDLTEARFTELRTLLGDPALDDVPDVSMGQGVADMFQYLLRFDGRTVMTDRTSAEPALDALIDALSEWLPSN